MKFTVFNGYSSHQIELTTLEELLTLTGGRVTCIWKDIDGELIINIKRDDECSRCRSTGWLDRPASSPYNDVIQCPDCGGSGRRKEGEKDNEQPKDREVSR